MLMASLITVYPLGMYLCYYHDEVWVTVIDGKPEFSGYVTYYHVGDKFRVQEKKK
jgi:hypothetical protein